jgi:hypothetical protein
MFDNICTPAQIYLIVSFILMVLSYFGMNAISQQITLNQANNAFLQSLNFMDLGFILFVQKRI